jgi:tetratricopeptide (TPR) repeat protein
VNAERLTLASRGYLELGMYREAAHELDALPPQLQESSRDITRLRVAIHAGLQEWERVKDAAERMERWEPGDPTWPVTIAYASRRFEGLLSARETLRRAADRFPEDALIQFNLGCYACQLGDLGAARRHLDRSIQIDPKLQTAAADDPDLEPLRRDADRA